jgi:hypothetical protein
MSSTEAACIDYTSSSSLTEQSRGEVDQYNAIDDAKGRQGSLESRKAVPLVM